MWHGSQSQGVELSMRISNAADVCRKLTPTVRRRRAAEGARGCREPAWWSPRCGSIVGRVAGDLPRARV